MAISFQKVARLALAIGASAALVATAAGERPLARGAQWKPAAGPLMTRWAKDVSTDNALPEYPRPQMRRGPWMNLNGLWDYSIVDRNSDIIPGPGMFDGKILVPFPIESALSGVMKKVADYNKLWYHRTFELPADWPKVRTLLHFGAVDWQTTVFVNGNHLGTHRGGYDEITLDITDALKPTGTQRLIVEVWDPTDAETQPRGKQVNRPSGIWYTSVTGIWQTVWLEAIADRIASDRLVLTPDIDAGTLTITSIPHAGADVTGATVTATALDGLQPVGSGAGKPGEPFTVPI